MSAQAGFIMTIKLFPVDLSPAIWSRYYMLLPLLTFMAFLPQFHERLGQLPLSITLESNLYNFLLLRYLPIGCMRCYLSVIDVLFMSSHALKLAINKGLKETKAKGRQTAVTVLHQGISRCPPHYCGVYKGLINHIITPHRIISPTLLQTVKVRVRFWKKMVKLYVSFHLKQCCIWLGGFHKTLNLGNRLVASYLHCTVWSCMTQRCANTNHKVHWLLCLMGHFHFLRCKK